MVFLLLVVPAARETRAGVLPAIDSCLCVMVTLGDAAVRFRRDDEKTL
jgi:hypothetical protein